MTRFVMAAAVLVTVGVYAGCGGSDPPAQTPNAVKEDVKAAGDKAGDAVEKAGDKIEEGADKGRGEDGQLDRRPAQDTRALHAPASRGERCGRAFRRHRAVATGAGRWR